MKHISIILLAMGLVLAGCSRDLELGGQQALIGFDGYFSQPTKAVQTDITQSAPLDSFIVTAIKNSTEFYFKDIVFKKGTGTQYNSTDKFYWPNFPLSFVAYSKPSSKYNTVKISDDKTKLAVTLSTSISNHEDLVAAYLSEQEYNGTVGSETKTFTFNHYLTQIEFKAKCSNSNYSVYVDSAKIANFKKQGNYTFSNDSIAATGSPTDFKVKLSSSLKLTTTEQNVNNKKKWYLIPQTVSRWDGSTTVNNAVFFSLKVKITSKGGATLFDGWTAVTVPDGLLKSGTTDKYEFVMGRKYTFIFDFFSVDGGGAGKQDPEKTATVGPGQGNVIFENGKDITFSTTVNEWSNEVSTDIKL